MNEYSIDIGWFIYNVKKEREIFSLVLFCSWKLIIYLILYQNVELQYSIILSVENVTSILSTISVEVTSISDNELIDVGN